MTIREDREKIEKEMRRLQDLLLIEADKFKQLRDTCPHINKTSYGQSFSLDLWFCPDCQLHSK